MLLNVSIWIQPAGMHAKSGVRRTCTLHTDTLGSHSYLLKFIVYSEVVSCTVMYGGMDVFIVWRIDLDEDRVSTVRIIRPNNGDDTLRTHY